MKYVIVDLEATCWENVRDPDRMEIIEIGAVLLGTSEGPVEGEFGRFVRPVASKELSEFCMQLTSIKQSDVDSAEPFKTVFNEFLQWIGNEPFVLCSWGGYDLNQIRRDCRRHDIRLPDAFNNHINLKEAFAHIYRVRSCGMRAALKHAKLPLIGTHHRGIDDARNIAKLAQLILPRMEQQAP